MYAKALGLTVRRIVSIDETGTGFEPPRPMLMAKTEVGLARCDLEAQRAVRVPRPALRAPRPNVAMDAAQTPVMPTTIETRFGLHPTTTSTLTRVLTGHVARSPAALAAAVLRPFTPSAPERRAYHALFQNVSRVGKSVTVEVAHHSARVLAAVHGFQPPPRGWAKDGEVSVRALLALAKAGVSCLTTEIVGASDEGTAESRLRKLTWDLTAKGIDLNRYWIPTVVLALLRSRAAFQIAVALR